MNKNLLWAGLGLQGIHMLAILAFFLASIDWGFLTKELIFGIGYVFFNVITLIIIVLGAIKEED